MDAISLILLGIIVMAVISSAIVKKSHVVVPSAFIILIASIMFTGHTLRNHLEPRRYEKLKMEGEVIQGVLDNVREFDNLSMENATISNRVIDYNMKLSQKKLDMKFIWSDRYYMDPRTLDLPTVK